MKTSEAINEFAAALAEAQGEIENPEKTRSADYPTKTGGRVKFNYADLAACYDVARAALAKHGISHVSTAGYVEKNYTLFLRFIHKSGQWIESEWPLPNDEPKVVGAHITYGTRYLFTAMAGIAPDEDMDADPKDGGTYTERKPPVAPVASMTEAPKHPSQAQIKRMFAIMNGAKVPEELLRHYIQKQFGLESSKDMTLQQYDQICKALEMGDVK